MFVDGYWMPMQVSKFSDNYCFKTLILAEARRRLLIAIIKHAPTHLQLAVLRLPQLFTADKLSVGPSLS
jgi:hypothetical protein